MKGVRKKLVCLIFASILLLICVPFCCSSIRTCLGLRHPKEVTGKDSAALRPGNVVSVEYEYAFEGYLNSAALWEYDSKAFVVLKLSGKEEYVYAVTYDILDSYWKNRIFFNRVKEMEGFQTKEKFLFTGKVCKTWDSDIESLKEAVLRPKTMKYSMPNTLENTNFKYYILYLNPAEEKETLIKRIAGLCLALLFWVFSLQRFLEEKKAADFLREEEKKEQEIQRRIELQKRLKQRKNRNDDEFWNRESSKEKEESDGTDNGS